MKQRILRDLIVITLTLMLVVSLLYTSLMAIMLYQASSPDCNSTGNSMVACEPSRYIPPLLMWGGLSALFIVITIVFTQAHRAKLNKH